MKTSIFEHFVETCEQKPHGIAIIDGEESITFSMLSTEVLRISNLLSKNDLKRNSVVGVYLNKSFKLIAADLAIGSLSCAYMNLDPQGPVERTKKIAVTVKPSIIITDTGGAIKLTNSIIGVPIIVIDPSLVSRIKHDDCVDSNIKNLKEIATRVIDTDPHCVINTSGSTGIPKSVILNHRGFIDFVSWACSSIGFPDKVVIGSLSPSVFDIFSFELCMLALMGSCISLIDEKLAAYPIRILEDLERKKISFVFWVPTIMVNIANLGLLEKFNLESLKLIWFAGEVFPGPAFNVWFKSLPGRVFVNLYGPIEITLDCSYHIVKSEIKSGCSIPIGRPCRNKEIILLTDSGSLANEGEIGEICVRGTGLAMGYLNNPVKTSSAFVQNPLNDAYPELIYKTGDLACLEDGILWFKGRKDSLIKHMGYRIELGEIESCILSSLDDIKNVYVIYNESSKEILAIIEANSHEVVDRIRPAMSQLLPKYMLPRRYEVISEMPMNKNGKIDRLRLKELYGNN